MTRTSAGLNNGTAGGWPGAAAELRAMPVTWGTVLASGIFGVVFGATVLIWPDVSLRVMAALTGVWLLVDGIARIIGAFLPGRGSVVQHLLSGIVGVVLLIAGLVCLRGLASRLAVLAVIFAAAWILSGITAVVLGLQRTGPARLGLLCLGALSVAVGVIFLLAPDLSLATLVVLAGVGSLLVGLAEVVLALTLRGSREPTQVAQDGALRIDGG